MSPRSAGAGAPPGKCLRLEFSVAPQTADAGLTSAGLLIVNPPWTLAAELKAILPELEKPLGQGGAGRFRLETPSLNPEPTGQAWREKSDLSRRQFAGNRIMLRPLGLALRSASANGSGGVTRPRIISSGSAVPPNPPQVAKLSGSECPVGPIREGA